MRILVHDYSGHPFQVQLSRELAKRKHEVLHLYSGSFQTPHGNLSKNESDPDNFRCQAIDLKEVFEKYSFLKRRSQEIKYGKLLIIEAENFVPDVVISSNTPLDPQDVFQKYCLQKNITFIFWLQDMYGVAIKKLLTQKLGILGKLIGGYYQRKEVRLLNRSNAIVAITKDFRPLLEGVGISPHKIYVINNWAPIEEVQLYGKDNPWSRKFKLHDKYCVLYAGTLGMKHNPQLLLDVAIHCQPFDDYRVIVISEGPGADFLKKKKEDLGLQNFLIMDFQPFEELSYVLASGDILLTILEKDAGIYCVPSKVLTYLCAKRPLVLAVPAENLAARIVSENAAGFVASPDDPAGFIQGIEELFQDKKLRQSMAENGRRYAKSNFNITSITDKFERIIFSAIS
ncbi:MAG: glycosyltransferase family 4 protein [Desulfobacter postgatei]|uniref:glycosyltransferase family 4 protein n=1 Tax=Desulfobacter postgatei TaxID=2293 RepID=UPI0023F2089E|nr:glycosyltransferase family 4 protein [Desulfobacter postgatei]MDD4275140.1 glycosyltransferase family 4 protein [Desulfobacter postgatei]